MRNRIKWFLLGSATYLTALINFKYAKVLPVYTVAGFPRSGTSWLAEMIADYFDLPRPKHAYLPLAFAHVYHTHFYLNSCYKNTFFIIRDGRDSYVSEYFKVIKLLKEDKLAGAQKYLKLFKDIPESDVKQRFYKYLEFELNKKKNWANYNQKSIKASIINPEISILKYENLKSNPQKEIKNALEKLRINVDIEILNDAIEHNKFDKQKRRPAEQNTTFLRKGEIGDWVNVFNYEAAILFDKKCGDLLIELGYEQDHAWIEKVR